MKEHGSNKSYNSRLIRWIDRLIPFDFNIEQIPGAKMALVKYISRQPNQEAKVTNKYDEDFEVPSISRIRDAIAAIYENTTQQKCQSQHFNSVNYTHSTRASHPHSINYSNLLSAINRNTTQLLLEKSASAAQIHLNSNLNTNSSQIQFHSKLNSNVTHVHSISQGNMSSPKSNPQTPCPQQGYVPVHTKLDNKFNTLVKRRPKLPQPGIVKRRGVRK